MDLKKKIGFIILNQTLAHASLRCLSSLKIVHPGGAGILLRGIPNSSRILGCKYSTYLHEGASAV